MISIDFIRLKVLNGWFWLVGSFSLLIAIPMLTLIGKGFLANNVWNQLPPDVFGKYAWNTILLMFGVGMGVLILGISTAWIISMYHFPGKSFFQWSLFLPLAMPAYIIAGVYVELLEYSGPVQKFLRSIFGWESSQDYWFPEISSLGGAIVMLALVLYPYIYLLAKNSFTKQVKQVIEVSRMFGYSPWKSLWKVALPLSRPAIMVGLAITLMETAGDFGTVQLFAVHTLTTGIYSVWFGAYNPQGAAQLATLLLLFTGILIGLERWSRKKQAYHQLSLSGEERPCQLLVGWKAWGAWLVCAIPFVFGFFFPILILLNWTIETHHLTPQKQFLVDFKNSLQLAFIAAIVCAIIALLMTYAIRINRSGLLRIWAMVASMGYAIPGPVIALGVLLPFAALDHRLDAYMMKTFGYSTGLFFSGTIFILIFAYLVRFLALSYGTIDAGFTRVTPNMEEASRSLGAGTVETLKSVHFPLLKGSVFVASLLVFVEVLKELPTTLMLQGFNHSTLATRVFEYASDERLPESSMWAVSIVLASVLPVFWVNQKMDKHKISSKH